MRTTSNKQQHNLKQRGVTELILVGLITVFHVAWFLATSPTVVDGVRPGEPLPTLPTIP